MTYFLNGGDEVPTVPVDLPEAGIPSLGERFGAGFTMGGLENDANFVARRTTRKVMGERVQAIKDIAGEGPILEHLQSQGLIPETLTFLHPGIVETSDKIQSEILRFAQGEAERDPKKWSGLGVSDQDIADETNARLQAEYADARFIAEVSPGGVPEFAGGMAAMTVDVKNIPFLLAGGGGGSFLRVVGREAFINMAAEMAFLPAQFDMAERLDIPDPNISAQLLMAAGGGAVFGGVLEGAARGISYWRGRQRVPEGATNTAATNADIEELEDALVSSPFEGVREVAESQTLRGEAPGPLATMPAPVRAAIAERVGASRIDLPEVAPLVRPDLRSSTAIPAPVAKTAPVDVTPALESSVRLEAAREASPEVFQRLEQSEGRTRLIEEALEERVQGQDPSIRENLQRIDEDERRATTALADPRTRARSTWKRELSEIPDRRRDAIARSAEAEGEEIADLRRRLEEESNTQRALSDDVAAAYRDSADTAQGRIAGLKGASESVAQSVNRVAADTERPTASEVFSDPSSPEARPIQDTIAEDLRENAGDLMVDMGDGKGERSVANVLDEIERREDFADALALCGGRRSES